MDYPFPYLNHGALDPDSFDKADSIWVAFRDPVSPGNRLRIMQSCPAAVAGFFRWDDGLFYSESFGDIYEAVVAEEFGDQLGRITAEGANAFSATVERWIREVHQANPVAFFIGPSRSLDEQGWNAWSNGQLGTTILPWLERYLDTHKIPAEVEESVSELEESDDFDAEPDEGDEGGPGAVIDDVPPSTPMDLYTLGTIVQHLEGRGTEQEEARVEALGKRIETAAAADDDAR